MKKTWIILKTELAFIILRRSFILMLVLIPLGGYLVTWVVAALQPEDEGQVNPLAALISGPSASGVEGFVDASGIIRELPKDLKPRLKMYLNEAQARSAYDRGEITAYFLVGADYLKSGKIIYARADYNPFSGINQTSSIRRALEYNLLGGDFALLARLQNPLNLEVISLGNQPVRDAGNWLTFFLPYSIAMFFYIMIFSSASLMLNSITEEKHSRVLEILLTSVTPLELLSGKIVALGLAGLLQTLVWSASGVALLGDAGNSFGLPVEFQLPGAVIVWGAIYFLLGYAMYGTLMAGLGALVPNLKEASQATMLLIVPMLVPLVFINSLISDSNGPLAVILSLVPFTAPVAMMTRLAAGHVSAVELGASVALLLLVIYLCIRVVARMFRAQVLLSGQPFHFKTLFAALFGKLT